MYIGYFNIHILESVKSLFFFESMNKVIFVLFKKKYYYYYYYYYSFRPSVRAHIQVIKTSHYLKHTKDTLHILGETFILEYTEGKYNRKH